MSKGGMLAIMALVVLGILLLVLAYLILLWLASWASGVICDAKLLLGLDC